jgi:hypothetical protein
MLANPALFYYNRTQRQTIAALLFQMLAVADFLTNSTFPFVIISSLLESQVRPIKDHSTIAKVGLTIVFHDRIYNFSVNSFPVKS